MNKMLVGTNLPRPGDTHICALVLTGRSWHGNGRTCSLRCVVRLRHRWQPTAPPLGIDLCLAPPFLLQQGIKPVDPPLPTSQAAEFRTRHTKGKGCTRDTGSIRPVPTTDPILGPPPLCLLFPTLLSNTLPVHTSAAGFKEWRASFAKSGESSGFRLFLGQFRVFRPTVVYL